MKKFVLVLFTFVIAFLGVSFASEEQEVVVNPGPGGGATEKIEWTIDIPTVQVLTPEEILQSLNAIKVKNEEWETNNDCISWVWSGCFLVDEFLFPNSTIVQLNERRTVLTIINDIVFAAIYMVWTVLTIVIIYCGLMYIFASKWWGDTSKYKKWLTDAAIWAILVFSAFTIIRLIQYIAGGRWVS